MEYTLYTDIIDLALVIIDDYELNALYQKDKDKFTLYMSGFLKLAIGEFIYCKQDLTKRDEVGLKFNLILTDEEQRILALLIAQNWFKRKVQDTTQIQNKLLDRDFKQHSEAQNLQAKTQWYNVIREEVDQALNNYGYKHSEWLNKDWKGVLD